MVTHKKPIYQTARYGVFHPITGEVMLVPNKKEALVWKKFFENQFREKADIVKIKRIKLRKVI
jgi:hypothetical protein